MTDEARNRLAAGLAKISLALRHHAWAEGERSGTTPTQAQILALLAARPAEGQPVSAIAAELAVSQPTISDSVAALARKKLVSKARSAEDGRVVLIRLTKRGRSQASATSQWPDALLGALGSLDEAERAVFVRALVKMIRSLQESGQIPVARMCTSCTYFRPWAHSGKVGPHHCAYVDAPFGEAELRLDCPDYEAVSAKQRPKLWSLFVKGKPITGTSPANID